MSAISKESDVIQIAALVSEALERAGITAVLSGGATVSIYSEAKYKSYDLDFVTSAHKKKILEALSELGFETEGRYLAHPETKYFLDFLTGPLAVGNEVIKNWARLETNYGTIQILTPTQCVMDRLAAFYHWRDPQGLDQALMVARKHKIDVTGIKKWSSKEGFADSFEIFARQLDKITK